VSIAITTNINTVITQSCLAQLVEQWPTHIAIVLIHCITALQCTGGPQFTCPCNKDDALQWQLLGQCQTPTCWCRPTAKKHIKFKM